MNQLLMSLRQLIYPSALRIAPWAGPDPEVQSAHLLALRESVDAALAVAPPSAPIGAGGTDDAFLVNVATRLWRARGKLMDTGSGAPLDGAQRALRHLDRLDADLRNLGVRTEDRTGTAYDPGMNVVVVASEPSTEVTREQIVETVRPAVYLGERLVQPAQVVVAVPDTDLNPNVEEKP